MRALFLLLISTVCFNASATHTLGGYISYRYISANTYEFTITIYQDINAVAINRNEIAIDWGYNIAIDSLIRDSLIKVKGDIYKSVFIENHTFPGPGRYSISVTDPNRIAGINNLSNSVNQPFYVATELSISPLTTLQNNSVRLAQEVVIDANAEKVIRWNLTATDKDEDYLFYELVDSKGIDGNTAVGYNKADSSSIDLISGELIWHLPEAGLTLITVKITECRRNVEIASTLVDLLINSIPGVPATNNFSTPIPTKFDADNKLQYVLKPTDTLDLKFEYTDNSATSLNLFMLNDSLAFNGKVTSTIRTVSTNKLEANLIFRPDSSDLRCPPYVFSFRGSSNDLIEDLTIKVFVHDSVMLDCDSLCGEHSIGLKEISQQAPLLKSAVFPNPFSSQSTIELEAHSFQSSPSLIIYNSNGKKITVEYSTYRNTYQLNGQEMGAGIYFYQLVTGSTVVSNGKFIVQ